VSFVTPLCAKQGIAERQTKNKTKKPIHIPLPFIKHLLQLDILN